MESTPSGQATTLASIIDAEKVILPTRARVLLASLAQVTIVPSGPASVREWSEAVVVVTDARNTERAFFAGSGAARAPADREANLVRHIDALRAAAVAMIWGRESANGPDGLPRFPRLRKLLVDQWDDTRSTCDSPDKFMMFFEATLALDRAAEPRAGRDAFKTLSLPAVDAAKKDLRVGTIGIPFDAIIDTGKFKRAQRPAPVDAPSAAVPSRGASARPQASPPTQSAASSPPPQAAAASGSRSPMPIIIGVIAVLIIAGAAIVLLK
ncbi:hypothetical protein BH09GEM1_BH09GEM1_06970 [soil metagenome]